MADLETEQTRAFAGRGRPNPSSGFDAPRRVGDYLIRRCIGEGGMGRVYEAEESLTKRRVALKVLHPDLAQSQRGRQQFVTEMSVLANLDSPHVVRCLRGAEIEGELVMVLEYLEGETLRERLGRARGPLPWYEVVDIAWQIAAALEAAHGSAPPIIHRDLKPENVMLVDGHVKVMDFGIAKVLQTTAGNTTQSAGTLQYMSPEQIDARPVDARSDLFALGLLMWEMLAGHPPFRADSPRMLLDQLCTTLTPPLPRTVGVAPSGLEQLVRDLLEKQPDRRPARATEVRARLTPLRPLAQSRPSSNPVQPVLPRAEIREPDLDVFDTLAIIERTASPRRRVIVPMPVALTIIVSLTVVAGCLTWLFLD